ncbi:hypothetical protein CCR94_04765 [Rhodoblastus sphagnicola]|uniref:Uncharacterized protein n=1 Tax=Rhodoblastus sphagnicola TaxID=333368 RepID=A0A2S6ND25_9HYPH|nr:helix-turn-helix transcriptional regulator [Rhodoblastus sphagnicola]MBB4198072.1 transcriptional regulator with XRE-family HTH domain [Rhodoblastus sphagnicola]PPQ32503.1 hypothetical protein CCR94_04765 [Rhodoblastus sphagnicola]
MGLAANIIELETPATATAINRIDRHIGARVRLRRLLMGIEHAALAQMIGATVPEVQRHEAGGSRIDAKRLFHICRALDVPASYFFEGLI